MSWHKFRRIADEQAALRRVATLVARGTSPSEVFGAVASELGWIMGAHYTIVCRYRSADTMVVVGAWARDGDVERTAAVGSSWPLDSDSVGARVANTGLPPAEGSSPGRAGAGRARAFRS
jgi:hypothetical protein